MKRFLVQHQMLHANPTRWADTLEEAYAAADLVWGPNCVDVRQEISDGDTGERWFRTDGVPQWHYSGPIDRSQ